jgi:uncharacterized protein YndB with AHSA1/START domain
MTVITSSTNPEDLSMTMVAEFDAAPERLWNLWEDPRQLERWWGPPTYPATVVDHDISVGGAVNYFMTSPEGDKYAGWWRVSAVAPPNRLEFEDGFADGEGRPNPDMPVTVVCVTLADRDGGGTRMEITSTFATVEAMDQLLAMGMDEGIKAAMGQIDAILSA